MKKGITHVALDDSKRKIVAGILRPEATEPELRELSNDPHPIRRLFGLVPSEYSSGDKERRGALTKAGNSHARRVLVEAAWHYRHRPTAGAEVVKSNETVGIGNL